MAVWLDDFKTAWLDGFMAKWFYGCKISRLKGCKGPGDKYPVFPGTLAVLYYRGFPVIEMIVPGLKTAVKSAGFDNTSFAFAIPLSDLIVA